MASRMRVKMCGMTRVEDIHHAIALGVDAIGFIFYPPSPRNVSLEQAKKLMQGLPPFVSLVAVVVDRNAEFLHQLVAELPIHFIQFHGSESPDFCRQFNKPFIKSIQAHSSQHIIQAEKEFDSARALLLDTPSEQQKGGTGLQFNWQIIPRQLQKPYILAGGLNERNILEALDFCSPFAVDVCSGIEKEPGIKDHHKMTCFIKKLGVEK